MLRACWCCQLVELCTPAADVDPVMLHVLCVQVGLASRMERHELLESMPLCHIHCNSTT